MGRKGIGARQDLVRIVRLRNAGLELIDEPRQGANRAAQRRKDGLRARQRVVEQAIQEILDRPGKLGEFARAHHAAAALQGMKRAAQRDERLAVERVLLPFTMAAR